MRQGLIYSAAREAAGYGFERKPSKNLALLPEPPMVRNPVVQKSLYEVRKVVNTIIKAYGKPDVIRVEMARDIVVAPKVREAQDKQNKINQKLNDRAREALAALPNPIMNPRHDDLLKYRLWIECGEVCPYTGKAIGLNSLFQDGVWDIEHIQPYSRTLDDSYMNKTLCSAEFNRLIKKGQTPWEIKDQMGGGWEMMLQRIRDLPAAKQRRIKQQELGPIDDFISRQLNDTRHIAVAVTNYLGQIGVDVQFTRGGMTSDLRHFWGLNSILSDSGEKERKDHRHHALDGIVIALTTRSVYVQLHRSASEREQSRASSMSKRSRFSVVSPWPDFREEIERGIAGIIVSHAPNRKLTGALHEDTAYGLIQQEGEPVFVYRKPLDKDFDEKQAAKIVDESIRKRVQERLAEFGNDPKKAFADLSQNPLYLQAGKKIPIKKVRIEALKVSKESVFSQKDALGQDYKYLKYGNNSHVEIFEHVDTGKRKGRFVTALEAARRARIAKTAVVDRTGEPGWNFVMSLAVNDLLRLTTTSGESYYRVQVIAATNETVWLRHHLAAVLDDNSQRLIKSANALKSLQPVKIQVDPIGRVTSSD